MKLTNRLVCIAPLVAAGQHGDVEGSLGIPRAMMRAGPKSIIPNGQATLKWRDVFYTPQSNDWIGHYCGSYVTQVADNAYLNWHYVTEDVGWEKGAGTETVTIKASGGSLCEFRMFRHWLFSSYHKIGTSNTFQVVSDSPPVDEVIMTTSPRSVASGESVTLSWENAGNYSPLSSDWIGYYCGDDISRVIDTAYLDWHYVTVDSNWASGNGSETKKVQSARLPQQCEFRMFRYYEDGPYYKLSTSNAIDVIFSDLSFDSIGSTTDGGSAVV